MDGELVMQGPGPDLPAGPTSHMISVYVFNCNAMTNNSRIFMLQQ